MQYDVFFFPFANDGISFSFDGIDFRCSIGFHDGELRAFQLIFPDLVIGLFLAQGKAVDDMAVGSEIHLDFQGGCYLFSCLQVGIFFAHRRLDLIFAVKGDGFIVLGLAGSQQEGQEQKGSQCFHDHRV